MNMNGTYIPIDVINPEIASKLKVNDCNSEMSNIVANVRLIASGNTKHVCFFSSRMSV